MIEKTFRYNSISVNYKLKSATADKRHLVVIFTGFMADYNYIGSGSRLKSNVLWIKDLYDSHECYYIGKDGELDYEAAVNALIENVLENLYLSKEECTLMGGSKGAFGALYIGIKYNYQNIISIAPLTKVGSRLDSAWPQHARKLMGEKYNEATIGRYDKLLLHAIEKDINHNKNIYLMLSENDQFYEQHQEYLHKALSKYYANTSTFLVSSKLIYQHNRMGVYNLPLAFMLINSLIDGIIPKFDNVVNLDYKISNNKDVVEGLEPIAILSKSRFDNANIHLSGVAFFRGISINSYGIYKKALVLRGEGQVYRYTVGTVLDKSISHSYYQNDYFDYSAGGFADLKGRGIDLESLPEGLYTLEMGISTSSIREQFVRLVSGDNVDIKSISGNYEYRLWDKNSLLLLSKRSIVNIKSSKKETSVFNLDDLSIRNNRLFISGIFAIPGIELLNWGDARYYAVLSNQYGTHSYSLGLLNRLSNNKLLEDGFGVYQKATFGTIKMEGIDISKLPEGSYNIHIILSYKSSLFKKLVSKKVLIDSAGIKLI